MSDGPARAATAGHPPLPQRVVVACTATLHGNGVVRLPDRVDADGPIAAFLVETPDDARDLLREIDAPGRIVFVDVERKQAVDLPGLAEECLQRSEIRPHKPNDATVRSLDVLVTHLLGFNLAGRTIGVVGTGNIGFKAALLFAERDADVVLHGRDAMAAGRGVEAIRSVRPRHGTSHVAVWEEQKVDVLITALSARGVVGDEWVARLMPGARVIDVGIGNLSAEFMQRAFAAGAQIVRLDTRTTGSQLVAPAPGFFEDSFGETEVDGVTIVSGGIIGTRGTVVVDSHAHPMRVLGIADGMGGLLPSGSISQPELGAVSVVEELIQQHEAKH